MPALSKAQKKIISTAQNINNERTQAFAFVGICDPELHALSVNVSEPDRYSSVQRRNFEDSREENEMCLG
jgi:hypothetical protein